jgi:hypothetical protein
VMTDKTGSTQNTNFLRHHLVSLRRIVIVSSNIGMQ